MGFSAIISDGEQSIELKVNAPGTGRFLRQFDPGDVRADLFKWRPPGVDGSYVLRNGVVGCKIHMTVRYVAASLEDLQKYTRQDMDWFAKKAMTITHNGQSYLGCNLVSGLTRRSAPVKATGRTEDQVFVDLQLVFSEDLPASITVAE